ncbi:immunoglobulin lambda-1 light chain-like [Sebastes fasciatus]|uniref:immunoglobulin lambda-1 light chain-like n=1 Tax=Sebastes fasciatus TaxID=394691 RepID=UPI003D9EDC1E
MLGILCTLITALTCVSGVTVVTQNPPVLTVRTGETVTMDCNLGTVTDSPSRWYKQTPGGVPQFVLIYQRSWWSVTYGSGFSSPKHTSNYQNETHYHFIINNVEEGDSAVYYCQTWDSSAMVFGPGTKLTVTSSSLSPPVLTVFPPSTAELQSNKASLVCLAALPSQFKGFADVTWLGDGCPVSSGISTSPAVQQPDQTFQISSYLSIKTSHWITDRVFTCKVSLGFQTAEKNMTRSDCPIK